MAHIWRDSRLSQRLKLRIYSTYIVSVLTWGLPAWRLGDVERGKLRGWNARLLTRLLGTEHENFGEVVRQQTREPLFDLDFYPPTCKLVVKNSPWAPQMATVWPLRLAHGTAAAPRDAYECARAPSRRAVARRRGFAATTAPDTAAAQKA
jgi:hypothetical protein